MGHNLKIFKDLRKCHISFTHCLSFDYRTNKIKELFEKKSMQIYSITKEINSDKNESKLRSTLNLASYFNKYV